MGVSVEIRLFAHSEAEMFVYRHVVFVVGFQIHGEFSAKLVNHTAQSALSARLSRDSDVFDVAIDGGIVILFRNLFGKSDILARKTHRLYARRGQKGTRKEGVEKQRLRVAVAVAGTLDRGDCEEILVDARVRLRRIYLVTEKHLHPFCHLLFFGEKEPVCLVIGKNVREQSAHFHDFVRFYQPHKHLRVFAEYHNTRQSERQSSAASLP